MVWGQTVRVKFYSFFFLLLCESQIILCRLRFISSNMDLILFSFFFSVDWAKFNFSRFTVAKSIKKRTKTNTQHIAINNDKQGMKRIITMRTVQNNISREYWTMCKALQKNFFFPNSRIFREMIKKKFSGEHWSLLFPFRVFTNTYIQLDD